MALKEGYYPTVAAVGGGGRGGSLFWRRFLQVARRRHSRESYCLPCSVAVLLLSSCYFVFGDTNRQLKWLDTLCPSSKYLVNKYLTVTVGAIGRMLRRCYDIPPFQLPGVHQSCEWLCASLKKNNSFGDLFGAARS